MFRKRSHLKSKYSLNIKEYNFDAPKISKKRKSRKSVKLLASGLLTAIVGLTLSGGVTTSSYAFVPPDFADTNAADLSCVNSWNNEQVAAMGGMTTTQITAATVGGLTGIEADKTYKKYDDTITIRERYGDSIGFTSWVPVLREPGTGLYQKDGQVWLYKNILTDAEWNDILPDTNNSAPTDAGWGGSSIAPRGANGPIAASAPIRNGESSAKNVFINDGLYCKGDYIWRIAAIDGLPNFIMQMAKGLNNVVTDLYSQATTGATNITDIVSLNVNASGTEDIYVKDTSTTKPWTQEFGIAVEKVLKGDTAKNPQDKGLYGDLYLVFLLPLVLIGATVILFNAIRTRAIRALTGVIWMIVSIVSGTLFLQNPMFIPKAVDGIVGTISAQVNDALLTKDVGQLCTIQDSGNNGKDVKFNNSKEIQCTIWYHTIFKPWIEGQFNVKYGEEYNSGDSSVLFTDYENVLSGTTIDMSGYDSDAVTASISELNNKDNGGWPIYLLEYSTQPQASNVGLAMNDFATGDPTSKANGFFNAPNKLGAAMLSLSITIAAGLFIATNSLLIIAYQITMLLLLLVAPIFFVIGIVPSPMGKGILLRWAELVVGIAVKRMVIALILAVFIKMFIIVSEISGIGLFMQMVVFGILSYLGITQRGKITEMFTGKINFGGDKSINIGRGIESVGAKTAVIAKGAAKMGASATGRAAVSGSRRAAINAVGNRTERKLVGMDEATRKSYLDKQKEKANAYEAVHGRIGGKKDGILNASRQRVLNRYDNGSGGYDFKKLEPKIKQATEKREKIEKRDEVKKNKTEFRQAITEARNQERSLPKIERKERRKARNESARNIKKNARDQSEIEKIIRNNDFRGSSNRWS